ncbi:hypothetical protein EMIHUDRAFT_450486 [Emiliania huxleyi CCMP1516]|uniref:Sulfotransferase domain-containing protein n=2 Tax=Emiliania huxleyi TaxID=2903 RepID=A0A0D3JP05_EMIH1|nr:hypothetical protein EMIHUDRAFT_450486 [Emiliania huxleyi CCMP1516]EOD25240.1 hypothetical protein EMIHUDRAFT_450486 [Emiliania huxleyi CCMP1516]|eukprot:XP_005777669.1 hypothetical protein EMIHUDRAFT_450486 [Emiliania huxleyi CCMP1516]
MARNCVFYLGARAQALPGLQADELVQWEEAQRYPLAAEAVGVHVMARETQLREIPSVAIRSCVACGSWGEAVPRLYYHADREVSEAQADELVQWEEAQRYPLAAEAVGVHVMARETQLREIVASWGEAVPRLYYHADREVAGMTWNTWLRFKMKAIFEFSVRAHWAELQETEWYDSRAAHYFGRPLHEAGYPLFVGGGAGIVLSRAAARGIVLSRAAARQIIALKDAEVCDPLSLKWAERVHSGGDAWLGDCAESAGVHTDMEFGFYPQPPVSNLFHLFADAVAFHGVENHAAMHSALRANGTAAAFDPRCVPVFADHKYSCLPHFIIGGVPKAGTTSLYKYLLEHPDAADRTVVRYLNKRIDNKMEKELSDAAPPFSALVADVAKTMASCGSPNRTFSMMDEYSDEMEEAGCYVNPFVGEGRYVRYLKLWLGMVPRRQLLLLNFDAWTASAEAAQEAMGRVAAFLQLAPFSFRAHNTHANRSVHVDRDAASDADAIKGQSVEAQLPRRDRCVLRDFFAPYNAALAGLLAQHGYEPMTEAWGASAAADCPAKSGWRFAEELPAAPHATGAAAGGEEERRRCGTVDHPCLAGSDTQAT